MFVLGHKVRIQLSRSNFAFKELTDDGWIVFPDDWALIFDPSHRVLRRGRLVVVPYTERRLSAHEIDDKAMTFAREFLGGKARLHGGIVDVPGGSWERVGNAVAVDYRRRGNPPFVRPGMRGHEFEREVPVRRHERGRAFELLLPRTAVIDAAGIVWP